MKNLDFYTVTANFDMSQYSDLEIKSFLHLENARTFAEEMKEQFLSNIPNRKLNEDETLEDVEHYYFKGECIDGENYGTISILSTNFEDDLFLNKKEV